MIQAPQTIEYAGPVPAHEYVLSATFPTTSAPPFTVAGFPTDWRLVVPENADGVSVYEVDARVPAGSTGLAIVPGSALGPGTPLVAQAFNPDALVLTVDGITYPLTGRPQFRSWCRLGRVRSTATMHADLGPEGAAEVWIDARAGVPQLDVCVLWHRASPGPDVTFASARFHSPAGAQVQETLPDPGLSATGQVTPGIVPQQRGRVFRFALTVPGRALEPMHVGVADWSRGGFGPSGLPVPHVAWDYGPWLASARQRLASNAPDYVEEPSDPSVSALWPTSGRRSGGVGGGWDRYPLDGTRWAASRDSRAREWYEIAQFRGTHRDLLLCDPDGSSLDIPAFVSWSFWDGFLTSDAPWEWDRWPSPIVRPDDPRRFSPHNIDALVRATGENHALVWLANDPLARWLTHAAAARARLTFPAIPLPPAPGLGSDIGTWQANAALAIAASRALGSREHDAWAAQYLAHLRAAQMQSGCFGARAGGYPSDRFPFDPDGDGVGNYLLQGGSEFAYTILAAYSLGDRDLARSAMRGVQDLATDDDDPGFFYACPTGLAGTVVRYANEHWWPLELWAGMGIVGSGGYYTFWDCGYVGAIAFATDAPERFELLRRFVGTADPATAASVLRGWGLYAPAGTHTDAPIEQWGALLGELER
jgi:hypothetical protein